MGGLHSLPVGGRPCDHADLPLRLGRLMISIWTSMVWIFWMEETARAMVRMAWHGRPEEPEKECGCGDRMRERERKNSGTCTSVFRCVLDVSFLLGSEPS